MLLIKEPPLLYICLCNAITEKAVRDCAAKGACSLESLAAELGVGTGCGRCRECAHDLLRDLRQEATGTLSATPA